MKLLNRLQGGGGNVKKDWQSFKLPAYANAEFFLFLATMLFFFIFYQGIFFAKALHDASALPCKLAV
jgi:hypothetical protein